MSREIKFRVWAHASGVMFYPDAEAGWTMSGGRLRELPNTTLMQYTGLKDKNGVEIYEGDIIEHFVDFGPGGEKGGYRTPIKITPYGLNTAMWIFKEEGYLPEIIGNIHENPELLA